MGMISQCPVTKIKSYEWVSFLEVSAINYCYITLTSNGKSRIAKLPTANAQQQDMSIFKKGRVVIMSANLKSKIGAKKEPNIRKFQIY